ncbi:MAG TPA: DUF2914 domain-containing protein [Vicinamibacterales bacterium]
MTELPDAGRLLELAEQAAIADDLESADELLRGVARIQESELGPLHPDLANTLNNLGIVAEKMGRLSDAETFYRRAVAIATASLPVDHPKIATSRENLEAFCRARGVPIETPALTTLPAPDAAPGPDTFASDAAAGAAGTPAEVKAAEARPVSQAPPPQPVLPRHDVRPSTPAPSEPLSHTPRRRARALVWPAIGVVFVTVAFLAAQRWSSRETPAAAPTAVVTTPGAAEPARPPDTEPPVRAAPIERARPLTVAPQRDPQAPPTDQRPAPSPSSGALTLAAAELCQTFSTSGDGWQCEQAGDQVSPGPMVLYTRVRSASDGVVVHRWYRGDALRQSVKLTTRANTTQGYRTYSRQTVDDGSEWRVEVRSPNADLLYERRFAVR